MQTNSFLDKLHSIFLWVTKLAFLNGLWLLFSLAGIIILGFFPATAAMLTVCRKWLTGKTEAPVYKTFIETYKLNFWKSNLLGFIFTGVGGILYLNFHVLLAMENTSIVYVSAYYIVVFFYIITLVNVFPVFVHFNASVLMCIKDAFIIGFIHFHISIAIIVSCSAFFYLMFTYPASALFFLGSIISCIQMWLALRSFEKLDRRIEKQAGKRMEY